MCPNRYIFIIIIILFCSLTNFSYTGRLLVVLGACGGACDILSMTVRMTKLPVTALRTPVTELLVIMRVAGLLVSFWVPVTALSTQPVKLSGGEIKCFFG